ncbi:NACHT domain-containing protein [Mycoavidus sp. HKI]|uniref:NACHT and WD40 repeat domain-containing protein n=1 Tax=Mycoavidus sp. HKI TaxID=2840467 RepID=UPI002157F25B|nr:NACHT domain-containing protein [Mycoavidus sp. HKI]UAW63596.2 NACHT domain-containing protein [Mycoavidus sp. HKI]
MMLGNPVSQALIGKQFQVQAQSYLEQARLQKTMQHFEVALALYDQAKVTFKHAGDAYQLAPPLSEMKSALSQARTPQTREEDALRQRIGEVYFERAELLVKLGKLEKAQASYKKAQAWGYEGIKSVPKVSTKSLPAGAVPTLILAATSTSMHRLSPVMSVQEKSELVDYLFEKALLTLNSLEVSNKPSLFLVYAHDNKDHGEAKASTSKYLINKLSKIRGVTLYSDQTPIGQAYSSVVENLEADGKLEDILTNQLCLLPAQLRADVEPVDKVIVCCSDVLGSYLKGQSYKEFCDELKKAYDEDRDAYLKDDKQKGTPALREVVRKFSQEEKYKSEFHHVLTEMAFLEIRAAHLKGHHGIIPVSLTPDSYDYCLKDFIESTTVRMEDPLRFDLQAKKGEEVYLNQGPHGVLFKVLERLLVGSDEAKTFLNKFWDGHSRFISSLKRDSKFGKLEFAKLLDGIFDGIWTALHSQLASTVQQQHHQLRLLNADPRAALKEQYFAALKEDEVFNETLQLYVEPQGKASLQGAATGLLAQVEGLLKDKRVILLKGDSGSGKTTFSRVLEKHLWETRKEAADAIPLFISLASIDKPEHDLIGKALKKRGLSEYQVEKLKKKEKFVFILDGYDEIRQTRNLYLSNEINRSGNWQGQMLISCGSEYLGGEYGKRFQPKLRLKGEDELFQELEITEFSESDRAQYLEKYVERNAMGWTAQQYQFALKQDHLKELVSTPFLLRVVLEALPYLENEEKERSAVQLRLDLYDQFFRQWFDRNQQWLSTQNLTGAKRELFRELSDEGFAEHGLGFVKELGVHLYTKNVGNPVVEYSSLKDEGSWKEVFFGREEKKQLLRETWPLIRSGTQYRFIHKSLLEYCVVRRLFDSFDACTEVESRSRRGSDASVYSFEIEAAVPRRKLVELSLWPKHWVGDKGVVGLLTDRANQEAAFKEQLLKVVERSKTDGELRQAASNAITILVKAGFSFKKWDLNGIQIPGADLSEGEFEGAQFEGSDLRKVNLRNTNIKHGDANLSGAKMSGVEYVDWSYVEEEREESLSDSSSDDQSYEDDLESDAARVNDISNWTTLYTLQGHTSTVRSVVYSPSGTQIASGSLDRTVRLWDAESGALEHTLEGHTSGVNSVVYSPSGLQIASGSFDNTVRLWEAESGVLEHTLEGHTSTVYSVVYSPSGKQLASGSDDNTVRLWDAHSGALEHTLEGHTDEVISVVYSPSGLQIASGSRDNTVRLWDAESGALGHTLEGHTFYVSSVVYSPSGTQIASGSWDNTVRLWDAESGALGHTLEGHTYSVSSVVYSPSGTQIASCSGDKTVRLWDAHSGALGHTLRGHTSVVNSVVYSPSGLQLASGSDDKTVRLWDAHSGALVHTLEGHTHWVISVMYSPSGLQIASDSYDNTVRLWEAQRVSAAETAEHVMERERR